jgi:ADP-dependent NAD(P)H-hydrate dehydratase / NAD(P)H-hydrate epimerase
LEAMDAASKASDAGITVRPLDEVDQADVVVDAIFGGGARRGLPPPVLSWMGTTAPVVCVDYPTGLDPDTGSVMGNAFRATETVTFGAIKTGHVCGEGPDRCGLVTVADIGIEGGEPSMFVAEEADAARPPRPRKTHKWSAGSVLVLGGSTGLAGASVLAGRSALHFGAGTVVVASPRPDLVQQIAPELPAYGLDEAEKSLGRFDVVVAGPGLAEEDVSIARPLLAGAAKIVLDAGGLVPPALQAAKEGDAEVVVTPHDGEFPRVAGVGAGVFAIRAFARKAGVTVLRKGNPTMVTAGGPPILVRTGGPELATIGTGDVLAGMIGALWARGLGPCDAAVSGAFWHGVAGSSLAGRGTVTADALASHVGRYAW